MVHATLVYPPPPPSPSSLSFSLFLSLLLRIYPPQGLGCGYDSIQTAIGLKGGCSELEKDLIDALAARSSKGARDGTVLDFADVSWFCMLALDSLSTS
jgi:hypothetical protein